PVTELIDEGIRATAAIRLANPPGGTATAEYRLRRLDGMAFEAEVVATTLTFHGRPASLLVVRDVTEAKQVQEQLLQAAKLATLGEMAAGLVHELSQPLNIIRMAAEGALMFIERGKASQEFQVQQFRLVDDQAQRAAEIIDDIRIFSRRDTSPMQVFDALTAVRAAIAVLQGQMRPDDITLLVELPDHPVLVRGRRVQLEQVVMNLLSNAHHALKEMRERGGDEGWNAVVRVSARPVGRELRVIVADNGPGLSPEVRARVFEPFFTTKEAGRGTGLGLSVSFGIVNSMGGRLEVCDSPAGASFSIALPIDGEASLATGAGLDQVPAAAAADAHIMVVDDEAMATTTLAGFLTELGYRVTVCASGSEAYQRFMADPADVVITDLRMPAGGGEQLVEKLRDFDPLLPIVIATGHLGATERLAENLQDDRCAVLKKPVALARLGDLIAGFLQPPD
ncbi:MAG: response regulator, partial [Magnetospirillum sp.]|nr:response regulator [Magnetospirillum sp.]